MAGQCTETGASSWATAAANASWRRTLSLPAGHFKFTAMAKVTGTDGPTGRTGEGAGLRIGGGTRIGLNGIKGTTPWQSLAYEFDSPGGDVVLVMSNGAFGGIWEKLLAALERAA